MRCLDSYGKNIRRSPLGANTMLIKEFFRFLGLAVAQPAKPVCPSTSTKLTYELNLWS